jgi:hypothetical protein
MADASFIQSESVVTLARDVLPGRRRYGGGDSQKDVKAECALVSVRTAIIQSGIAIAQAESERDGLSLIFVKSAHRQCVAAGAQRRGRGLARSGGAAFPVSGRLWAVISSPTFARAWAAPDTQMRNAPQGLHRAGLSFSDSGVKTDEVTLC